MHWFLIGMGGVAGSFARYLVNLWLKSWAHPAVGTLVVNFVGCFLIGFVAAMDIKSGLPKEWRLGIEVGFLGAFTTFSAFGLQSVQLINDGNWGGALANVLANVVLGFGAVALALKFFA